MALAEVLQAWYKYLAILAQDLILLSFGHVLHTTQGKMLT